MLLQRFCVSCGSDHWRMMDLRARSESFSVMQAMLSCPACGDLQCKRSIARGSVIILKVSFACKAMLAFTASLSPHPGTHGMNGCAESPIKEETQAAPQNREGDDILPADNMLAEKRWSISALGAVADSSDHQVRSPAISARSDKHALLNPTL